MLIRHTAEVLRVHSKRGTENTHAALILQLAIRLDRIRAEDRGNLMGFTGEEIEITLRAENHVDPAAERPMETLWSGNGTQEHARPGPTESCSECGRVIGDDPDADFYAPLAGPSRPVCGDCAVKLDDRAIADEAESEEREVGPLGRSPDINVDDLGDDDVTQFEYADGRTVTLDAEGEAVEETDAALGDRPMPERPADEEPVTTPIRRGRGRAASAS